MLIEFCRLGTRVDLDVLIGDETQDFSRLQWRVFWQLARGARRVCVAGDDDQAIYRWAGADVDHLIDLSGDVRVLGQSWRCPPAVQLLSQEIVGGIARRRPKTWRARDGEQGRFGRVASFADASPDDDWAEDDAEHARPPVLVLARNVYLLRRDVEPLLRAQGVVYETSGGKSSLDLDALAAAEYWTRLSAGGKITVAEVEHLFRAGELNPDEIHTPGIFVKRIVHVPNPSKHIEQRTTRKHTSPAAAAGGDI